MLCEASLVLLSTSGEEFVAFVKAEKFHMVSHAPRLGFLSDPAIVMPAICEVIYFWRFFKALALSAYKKLVGIAD